jgi:hypothetical protein
MPDGVKPDQTLFEFKGHETLTGGFDVGSLSFENGDYEAWGVVFDATTAQLEQFIAAMETNGFYGGQTDFSDYDAAYEWLGNGYYAYMSVRDSYEDGYDKSVSFEITKDLPESPSDFFGAPLPDAGVLLYYYEYAVDENENDIEDFWAPGAKSMPDNAYYSAEFNYFGVTRDDASACAQQLVSAGWEMTYEDDDDYGTFNIHLQKSDKEYALIEYNEDYYSMQVGFANMAEGLGN